MSDTTIRKLKREQGRLKNLRMRQQLLESSSRSLGAKAKTLIDESIVNGERHDTTETEGRARAVEKPENAATVIREFEQIIRSKSKNII